jgi:acyl carrier protein
MTVTTEQNALLDLLIEALARHTGTAAADIRPAQRVADIPGMESVRLLRLLTEFQDEHAAGVPDTFPFDVATVQDLAEGLARSIEDGADGR